MEKKAERRGNIFSIKFPGTSPQGIAWIKGNLAVADAEEKVIYILDPSAEGEVKEKFSVPLTPSGIDWDGELFLLTDSRSKYVIKVDMNGKVVSLINLNLVKFEKMMPAFLTQNSSIWGVAWNSDSIWVSCEAGYSSSIYNIIPEDLTIKQRFWAHGPRPKGLYYDIEKRSLLSVDARNLEITRISREGKLIDVLRELPSNAPTGITLDEDNNLWIADEKENKIFKVRWK